MIVYFLRHANAGQKKSGMAKDNARPLDKEGLAHARHIGRLLAVLEVEVDAIISSPLKRATQTASVVANEIGYERKFTLDPGLRPEATFDGFRKLLTRHEQDDAILVVGHNPSITAFLSSILTKHTCKQVVDFKKGGVAKVEIKGNGAGILSWYVTPKLVRAAFENGKSGRGTKAAKRTV